MKAQQRLTWRDCEPLFEALHEHGVHPIVVGGQAVNLWADYYTSELQQIGAPVASKDIDVLGNLDLADQCAKIWGGKCRSVNPVKSAIPMSAVVTVGENGLRVDFQCDSVPNTFKEIEGAAIPLPTEWGTVTVMHPLHCLKSRAHNVVNIWASGQTRRKKYDNPHGLRQLTTAIDVFKSFTRERLRQGDAKAAKAVLANYEKLFKFARSDTGQRLWQLKHIDLFSCIVPLVGLPEQFFERRYPQMCDIASSLTAGNCRRVD